MLFNKLFFIYLKKITIMIIYGTKGTLLNSIRTKPTPCRHCNEQRPHTMSIYGKYFYIYWIPFFPFSKKGISECNHCKVSYDYDEMNEPLQRAFDNLKADTKSPLKHWIGLLIIGLLFSSTLISSLIHIVSRAIN